MKLGAGIAPVLEMLRRGIDVGLGTDGCASNNDLDLFGEMGMAAKLHKVFSGDSSALKAERVVEMATMGGARILGMEDRIGSIVPGKQADIILVDINRPHLTPLYNPFSHLVYAARGADVVTSIIGGKIVMKERRLLQIDVSSTMEEVRRIASRISAAGFHHTATCFNPDSGVNG
jgi:5-methylthioadenosine/S-adenosylhomocysteine deaminase